MHLHRVHDKENDKMQVPRQLVLSGWHLVKSILHRLSSELPCKYEEQRATFAIESVPAATNRPKCSSLRPELLALPFKAAESLVFDMAA